MELRDWTSRAVFWVMWHFNYKLHGDTKTFFPNVTSDVWKLDSIVRILCPLYGERVQLRVFNLFPSLTNPTNLEHRI